MAEKRTRDDAELPAHYFRVAGQDIEIEAEIEQTVHPISIGKRRLPCLLNRKKLHEER